MEGKKGVKVSFIIVFAVILIFFSPLTEAAVQAMSFGKTTVGGTLLTFGSNQWLSKAALGVPANVTAISAYLKWDGDGSNNIKAAIYSDNSNTPGTLIATSQSRTFTTTPQWVNFTFTMPVQLTPGTYWLSILAQEPGVYGYGDDSGIGGASYAKDNAPWPDPISLMSGAGAMGWGISIYAAATSAQSASNQDGIPDLTLEILSVPSFPKDTDQLDILYVIKNIGTGTAGQSKLNPGPNVVQGDVDIPQLAPLQTYTVNFSSISNSPSVRPLDAQIDKYNSVAESDETNNRALRNITIIHASPSTFGNMELDTIPHGALVRVDGMAVGTTPLTTSNLGWDFHHVNFTLPNYMDQIEYVLVQGGSTTKVNKTLVSASNFSNQPKGFLALYSEPPGAQVVIGTLARIPNSSEPVPSSIFTPVNLEMMPGVYMVSIIKEGYQYFSQQVVIYEGFTTTLNPTFVQMSCFDSDGGPYATNAKGSTFTASENFTDYCVSPGMLAEGSCSWDNSLLVNQIYCECYEGRCLDPHSNFTQNQTFGQTKSNGSRLPIVWNSWGSRASVYNRQWQINKISAFLEWDGSGSNQARAFVYTDLNGVPHFKVAESDIRTFTTTPSWVDFKFTKAQILGPGNYWLSILAPEAGAYTNAQYQYYSGAPYVGFYGTSSWPTGNNPLYATGSFYNASIFGQFEFKDREYTPNQSLPLLSQYGYIFIDSFPQGASVLVDGIQTGVTPVNISVPQINFHLPYPVEYDFRVAGNHSIVLTMDGYEDNSITAFANDAETTEIYSTLIPKSGDYSDLTVTNITFGNANFSTGNLQFVYVTVKNVGSASTPPGGGYVDIDWDNHGTRIGFDLIAGESKTVSMSDWMNPGGYYVSAKVGSFYYNETIKTNDVKTTRVYVGDLSNLGNLEVNSNVQAEVYIDGAFAGQAPITLESIKEGVHILKLKKAGYQDSYTFETVTKATTTAISRQLQPISTTQTPDLVVHDAASIPFSSIPMGGAPGYTAYSTVYFLVQNTGGKIANYPVITGVQGGQINTRRGISVVEPNHNRDSLNPGESSVLSIGPGSLGTSEFSAQMDVDTLINEISELNNNYSETISYSYLVSSHGSKLAQGSLENQSISSTQKIFAFIGGSGGLRIIDVSNPAKPVIVGTYSDSGMVIQDVFVQGNTAYASTNTHLIAFDVTDKTKPKIIYQVNLTGQGRGLDVDENYIYVANYGAGSIEIFNKINLASVGSYPNCPQAHDIKVRNKIAFMACNVQDAQLRVVDVTNPANPVFLARGWAYGTPKAVSLYADRVLLVSQGFGGRVESFDISNIPGNYMGSLERYYTVTGSYKTSGFPYNVDFVDGIAYIADSVAFEIINAYPNISVYPNTTGSFIGKVAVPGYPMAVVAKTNYAYVASDYKGLQVVDISVKSSPKVAGGVEFDSARAIFVQEEGTPAPGSATNTTANQTQIPATQNVQWSTPVKIVGEQRAPKGQKISFEKATGNFAIVWEDSSDGSPDIYYSRITPSAIFSQFGKKLTNSIYNSKNPSVFSEADKTHIVWQDDRDGNNEIYYSQIVNGETTISNKRVTYNLFESTSPKVVSDGSMVHVFNMDNREGKSSLYYTKLDNSGNQITADVKLVEQVSNYTVAVFESKVLVSWISNGKAHFGPLLSDAISNPFLVGDANEVSLGASTQSYLVTASDQGIKLHIIVNLSGISKSVTLDQFGSNPSITVGQKNLSVAWNAPYAKHAMLDFPGFFLVNPNQLSTNSKSEISGNTDLMMLLEQNGAISIASTTTLEKTPPIILLSKTEEIQRQTIRLSVKTDEPSYVSASGNNFNSISPQLNYSHVLILENLLPSTNYNSDISATDVSGNRKIMAVNFLTKSQASKPSLPTTFYGTVRERNGALLGGINVTAYWTDSDNKNRTTSVKSVESGAFMGYYIFNKTNINAKDGSTIVVSAPDFVQKASLFAQPGNLPVNVSTPVIVDKVAPIININEPKNAWTYSSSFLTLNFSASEPLSFSSFTLNNNAPVSITGMEGKKINMTAKVGQNSLTLFAKDIIGIAGQTTITFSVEDNLPPVVKTNANAEGARNITMISASVTDSTNSLDSCQACLGTGCSWREVQDNFEVGSMQGSCYYLWDTTQVPDGLHPITFAAKDESGNIGTSATITIKVDNTKPPQQPIVTEPVSGQNKVNLKWQQSSDSDFKQYVIYRSSSPAVTIANITSISQTQFTDTTVESGKTYSYAIVAVDNAGNSADPVFQQITMPDTAAPTISILQPISKTYSTSSILLDYNVSEQTSWCGYKINNRQKTTVSGLATINADEGNNFITIYCNDTSQNQGNASMSFIVDTTPPTQISFSVSPVPKQNQLRISWIKSQDIGFARYNIYRSSSQFQSTTTATKIATIQDQNTILHDDLGLLSEQTYFYSVTATDIYGNENTNVMSSSGKVADTNAPPALLTNATAESRALLVKVSWGKSNVADFGSYNIYRRTSQYSSSALASKIASINQASTVNFTDANVSGDTQYYYSVAAQDSSGNENLQVTTAMARTYDSTAPLVMIFQLQNKTYATRLLDFSISVNEPANCTYTLNNNTKQSIVSAALVQLVSAEGGNKLSVNCTDSNLNNGSAKITFSTDTIPPPQVPLISVNAAGANIKIVWQPSTFAHSYNIYRNTVEFSSATLASKIGVASSSESSFNDTNVQSETKYYYAVASVDSLGNENTTVVSRAATTLDLASPSQVQGLSISPILRKAEFNLTWSLNSEKDVKYYAVYRSTSLFLTTHQGIFVANTTTNYYYDLGLKNETNYYYAVTAVDNSTNENKNVIPVLAMTPDVTPPAITLRSPESKTYGSSSIPLDYLTSEPSTCTYSLNNAPGQTVPFINGIDGINTIVLSCQDLQGNPASTSLSFVVDTTPPGQVLFLVSQSPLKESVTLSWIQSEVVDFGEYVLYKSEQNFSSYPEQPLAIIKDKTATSYVDSSVKSLQTYYYDLAVRDIAGNSISTPRPMYVKIDDLMPPNITIISPEDKTLYNTLSIPLGYSTSEPVSNCSYEINGENHAETENITAREGQNTLVLTCEDLDSNTGSSIVQFFTDSQAPAPIIGLRANWNPNSKSIWLNWDPSGDSDLKTYNVYRSNNNFQDLSESQQILTTSKTQFQEINVESEKTYYYAVSAVDLYNNENKNVIAVEVIVPDIIPPSQIQDLKVSSVPKQPAVMLTWNPKSDSDFDHYTIYRSNLPFSSVSPNLMVDTISDQKMSNYTDFGLANGMVYYYAMTSTDKTGNEIKTVTPILVTSSDLTEPTVDVQQVLSPAYGILVLRAQVTDNSLKQSCEACITQSTSSCNWETATNGFKDGSQSGTCTYTWQSPNDGQSYYYTFRVNDTSENHGEGEARQFSTINLNEEVNYDLELYQGWNLISFPITPKNNNIKSVMAPIIGKYTKLFYYDLLTQSWNSHFADDTIFNPEESITTVEPGKGYWIEVLENTSLRITGKRVATYSGQLQEGWNIVGYPYEVPVSPEIAFESSSYYSIFFYNTIDARWEYYSPNPTFSQPNTITALQPGQGYMIDMRQDTTWAPQRPQ